MREDDQAQDQKSGQAKRPGGLYLPARNRLDAGADDYILKPFSPRQMLAKVREVLGA